MQDTATKTGGAARVVLPCEDLDAAIRYFRETLGFRLDMIFPADAPRVAVISGHGLTVRLDAGYQGAPGRIELEMADADETVRCGTSVLAPNGTEITFVARAADTHVPPVDPAVVLSHPPGDGDWHVGRAGMQYRDLIPGRLGGAWIASHIRIPDGGPVPDYVHYHEVRFQLIYCRSGWVKLVYEDQGPPFVMRAGDCVLQPPCIRHRVLECSAAFEVVELGSPAEHVTLVDHVMGLPTGDVRPRRDFGGQRFCLHRASEASWAASEYPGLEQQATGIAEATAGIAAVRVLRPSGDAETVSMLEQTEFLFRFVLDGALTLRCDGQPRQPLRAGASVVIPAGLRHRFEAMSGDLRVLEVRSPA
jgi:quercetin dioxygenase-like cupin family protein